LGEICTQNLYPSCTQTAHLLPIYAVRSLPNLLKPRTTGGNGGFCKPLPYHLATAPPTPEAKPHFRQNSMRLTPSLTSRRPLWRTVRSRSPPGRRSGYPIRSTNRHNFLRFRSPASTSARTTYGSCARRSGNTR